MGAVGLNIYRNVDGAVTTIASANKWKFQDTAMGEQFITCTITSEVPIDWKIGDHCVFRGQTYTLNYIPSVTQKAGTNTVQDAYTYENVKLDSFQDELTRCMMLDITPTTDQYIAVLGTNYTGSSRFQLYCGETVFNGATLTPVCALALKMQANLDRLYPQPGGWHIHVDTTTTYTTVSGETELVTHTDSKLLTFDNQTVAQALGMVHTEFKLDYCVKGRNIYIGYSIDSTDEINPVEYLTGDDIYPFGYGKGYPSESNQGKGLFQIKQIANSQQKIVTRLRALGSTKNMPYRYYHKRYADTNNELSQALFPTNLQLPGTFLPEGQPADAADLNGTTKWAQNNARSQYLRKVKGDTNDAYIDKNDDAAGCLEGIREDCARWDGSNGDLPEIYPTIEGVTFGELRDAGVPDQTGATGPDAYQGGSVQPNAERIDNLLAVGYVEDGVLVNDANIGDGIRTEDEIIDNGQHFPIGIGQTKIIYDPLTSPSDASALGARFEGTEQELFTVKDVVPGYYFMAPTGPSYSCIAYRFSVAASENIDVEVGFVIKVKQRVGDQEIVIAEWESGYTTIASRSGEKEMFLPEIPDQATSGQVESIHVTELSDIVVTFAPLIGNASSNSMLTLTYLVGRSLSGDYDPEYNWGSVQGSSSQYPFHVFIKDMGFDLTATFNGETPVMAMKSGACVGREFEIGENVVPATVNGKRGYLLTLNRAVDSNINAYYPSENYPLSAGDYFVLLNINMPDAYIRAAELRLLKAATEYLADNCDTKYTYQPFIDDIYLQRNIDENELAGTREKSIFWRLYAGLKFWFNGIPASEGAPLPSVNMTIEQVTITMGEGLTPKVDIVLNDDVQQTTLQKLTVAVDRIYNGSIFGGGGVGTNMEAVVDIGSRLFLSKTHDDTANGRITFKDIATFNEWIKAKNGIQVGDFLSGFLGSGAQVDYLGNGEFESLNVRGALRAAELVFNRISAEEGEAIRSIGHGEILTVDEENMTATLKLEGDEWATIAEGDICRGLYNTINKDYDNAGSEGEDANGFRLKSGFFASYFKVEEILSNGKGECSFRYSLQPGTTEHPCELMKFAVYGNTDNSKTERQSSMYITAVGIAPRLLFLSRVNDWKIKPENIKIAMGNINGLQVYEIIDGNPSPKTLYGDAGLFVEDNIYFGGILNQFTAADWDYIQQHLGKGISAQLLRGSDNIVVDILGNIVGGIYEQYGEDSTGNRHYRLHTGVLVYDSGKKRYLSAAEDNENIGEDEYAIYYTCDGCDVIRDGADFYITAIHNTNDGLSGTTLTNEQLELMRNTDECRVNFVIVTHSGWRTMMSYPVRITHLDHAYITFDLDNEFDSIAYRTHVKRYDLGTSPVRTGIHAYINGVELVDKFVSVSMESDLFTDTKTVGGSIDHFTAQLSNSGLAATIYKSGLLVIDHTSQNAETDLADAKHYFDISATVKYAGVKYESGKKRFVLQEITDATLYKLLLSANAVSKDEGSYTPSSIDVKLQVIDNNGTHVYTESDLASGGNIKIRYINGVYDPSVSNATLIGSWTDTQPALQQVPTCLTVLAIDNTDTANPVVLDVESVTINAVGRDGAGQPWVYSNLDQIVIDCNEKGEIIDTITVTIDFKLYWGDQPCVIRQGDSTITYGQAAAEKEVVDNYTIRHTHTFTRGDVLASTRIVASLQGQDGEGDSHAATKTIPVVSNKQGSAGDPGRGIVSSDTYYKVSIEYSGIIAPATDVLPSSEGWSDSRMEPTESEPYLWRFTRTVYSKAPTIEQTDAELVYVWQDIVNPNLLDDTEFLSNDDLGAWHLHGAVSSEADSVKDGTPVFGVSSKYDSLGYKQYYGKYKALANGGNNSSRGYISFLSQYVYNGSTGVSKIDPGQWYTLSFYLYGKKWDDGAQDTAAFLFACSVASIADVSGDNKVYVDGAAMSDSYVNIPISGDSFVRHTVTFKSKPELAGKMSVAFQMYVREYTQEMWLCKPKLEIGSVATDYRPRPEVTEPLIRTGEWKLGAQYYQGKKGEPYIDVTLNGGQWNRCVTTHVSTNSNKPVANTSNKWWQVASNLNFAATNLLLAQNAVINMLSSNVINLFNASNVKTASINADGNGEYCIYHPNGNKRMTFSYDGFIHYYYENGAEAWRIGMGGNVEKFTISDFVKFPLCALATPRFDGTGVAVKSTDRFTLDETMWRYKSGSEGLSQYDSKIYDTDDKPTNPATANVVADGWYTPDEVPHQVMVSMDDTGRYAIAAYYIENGFVLRTLELTEL